jgi:CHRD domain-containing protein
MKTLPLALTVVMTALPSIVRAERIEAKLIGYQEVPSVSTPATGEFKAKISSDEQSIDYELTFSGLVGTVQQSHIHVAQRGVNGSIVVWLCQTATTPAPAAVAAFTPTCPQSGTVTGTINAAHVITASTASQQITAGQLDKVIAAIRAGVAYANVHATPLNPGGEIRGQIHAADENRRDR